MKRLALLALSILLSVNILAHNITDEYCGVYKCTVKRKRIYPADPNIYYSYDTISLFVHSDTLNTNQLIFIDSTYINDPEFIIDSNTYTVSIDTLTDHFTTEFLYGGYGDFFLTNDSIQMFISGGTGLWGSVAWYYYGKKIIINTITDFEQHTIKIYPNPVINKLNIDLLNQSKTTKCLIFNINGQLVLNREFTNHTSLYVSNLPKGIYIVKVIFDEKYFLKKIIIN